MRSLSILNLNLERKTMSVPFEFADPKALLALPNGSVKVTVTAPDMAQGQRFEACACPIAFALSRQFGLPRWNIIVCTDSVTVRDNSGRVIRWWRLDDAGCEFRLYWDAGQRDQEPAALSLIPQPVPYMDACDVLRPVSFSFGDRTPYFHDEVTA